MIPNNKWQGLPRFIRRHGLLRPVNNNTRKQRKINARARRAVLAYGMPMPSWLRRKGDPK